MWLLHNSANTSNRKINFYTIDKDYIAIKKRLFLIIICFLAILPTLVQEIGGSIDKALKKYNLEKDHNIMMRLAESGSDLASLWIIRHYPLENPTLIKALEEKGYAEAFYFDGGILAANGNKAEGNRLIKIAADKGLYEAIKYLEQVNKP